MMSLYDKIKSRREELEMTQDELAQKLGYKSRSTIAKIEAGENDITQSKIKAFADALHTTPAYLMGWEDDSESKDESREVVANKLLQYANKPDANEVLEVFELIDSLSSKNRELVLNLIESMKKNN